MEIGRTKKQLEKKHFEICEKSIWIETSLQHDEVMLITKKDILESIK